jgi:hypothetical protein
MMTGTPVVSQTEVYPSQELPSALLTHFCARLWRSMIDSVAVVEAVGVSESCMVVEGVNECFKALQMRVQSLVNQCS